MTNILIANCIRKGFSKSIIYGKRVFTLIFKRLKKQVATLAYDYLLFTCAARIFFCKQVLKENRRYNGTDIWKIKLVYYEANLF